MQLVLDAPVPAIERKQITRVGFLGTQACDRVRDVGGPLAIDDSCALDTHRLSEPGPVKVLRKPATALKIAYLNSPVPFVYLSKLIKLLTAQAFAVGGKGRD